MKNTTHYSVSDIQRYLKGEMSAREMFEIEKAALEDPFLADAIEGYEAHPAAADDVNELHNRLHTRLTRPGKVRLLMPWLRIAASIVLLIGLGFGAWYFLLNTTRTGPTTVATGRAATQKQAPPQQQTQPPAPAAAADSTTPPSLAAENSRPTSARAADDATPSLKRAKTPPPAKPATVAPEYAKIAPPAQVSQVRTDSVPYNIAGATPGLAVEDKNELAPSFKSQKKFQTLRKDSLRRSGEFSPKVFSGKVLDFNNKPLPGATLQLAGRNDAATVTDNQGNFSLKLDPKTASDSILRVNVGMIGYEPSSLAFNAFNPEAATGNLIYLKQQSNALDEVVVIGYGSKRKETKAFVSSPSDEKIDSLWISAMPVSGRQAYLDYLAAGKKTIGADSTIRGTVVVSFDVSRKGTLSSFKVERSLTPAHDAGVIRLVSEGPPWKVSKNHPVRAAVRVTF